MNLNIQKMETRKTIAYHYNNINKETLIILESYLLDKCENFTLDVRKSNINTDTGKKEEVYYGYFETEKEVTKEDIKKFTLQIW